MKNIVFGTLLLLVVGCRPIPTPAPDPSVPTPTSGEAMFVAELIDAHNKIREEHNLAPLGFDATLQQACEIHTKDMAAKKFMSHTGSDGSSPFQRMTKAGYNWSNAGENVAWNQQTVDVVMTTWMNSLGHRANILGKDYTQIGAACVYSANGEPYWCVDFGTPAKQGVMAQGVKKPVVHLSGNASSISLDNHEN